MSVDRLRQRAAAEVERRTAAMAPGRRLRFLLAQETLRPLSAAAHLRVLDAGCEDGLLTLDVARRHPGWFVIGADLNSEALARGRRAAEREGVTNVAFVQADLTRPLGEAGFDVVLAMECLAEIPDDDDVLRTLAAALRPSGRLVVHVPEADWKPVLAGSRRSWHRQVRSGYRADELRAKLEGAGLRVQRLHGTTRNLAHLAQEVRDRWVRDRTLKVRAAALGPMELAARLDRWGVTWGPPHALLAEAVKR